MATRREERQATYHRTIFVCDDCGSDLTPDDAQESWGLQSLGNMGEEEYETRSGKATVSAYQPTIEFFSRRPYFILCPDCAGKIVGRLKGIAEKARRAEELQRARELLAEAEAITASGKSRKKAS